MKVRALRGVRSLSVVALVGIGMLAAEPTRAMADLVVFGLSDGYEVSVNVNLTLISTVQVAGTIGPVPTVSGTAPAPYNNAGGLANLNATSGTFAGGLSNVASVNTGLITLNAQSNVDLTPGSKFASASTLVNGLGVGLVNTTFPIASTFLNLSATTVSSSANVSGNYNAFTRTGTSIFQNLKIDLLGLGTILNLTGSTSFAPNTIASLTTPVAGLSVILNEQILSGNNVSTAGLDVNAIHLRLTGLNVTGIGSLTGDIIIGHAHAQIAAVPEPSSLIMCGTALVGLIGIARVRRRRPSAA